MRNLLYTILVLLVSGCVHTATPVKPVVTEGSCIITMSWPDNEAYCLLVMDNESVTVLKLPDDQDQKR